MTLRASQKGKTTNAPRTEQNRKIRGTTAVAPGTNYSQAEREKYQHCWRVFQKNYEDGRRACSAIRIFSGTNVFYQHIVNLTEGMYEMVKSGYTGDVAPQAAVSKVSRKFLESFWKVVSGKFLGSFSEVSRFYFVGRSVPFLFLFVSVPSDLSDQRVIPPARACVPLHFAGSQTWRTCPSGAIYTHSWPPTAKGRQAKPGANLLACFAKG